MLPDEADPLTVSGSGDSNDFWFWNSAVLRLETLEVFITQHIQLYNSKYDYQDGAGETFDLQYFSFHAEVEISDIFTPNVETIQDTDVPDAVIA